MLVPRQGYPVTARLSCLVTERYANASVNMFIHHGVILFGYGTVCKLRGLVVQSRRGCIDWLWNGMLMRRLGRLVTAPGLFSHGAVRKCRGKGV